MVRSRGVLSGVYAGVICLIVFVDGLLVLASFCGGIS